MNLIQVKAFLAAARTLSFTQAAEELFLSQQAVSKYIGNLELELGFTLFKRAQGGVSLTDEGIFYNNLFSNELARGHRLLEEARLERIEIERRFRIGFSDWVDPFGELDKGLSVFRAENPQIFFNFSKYQNDMLIDRLSAGDLDVALISSGQISVNEDFECIGIAEEHISLCVPSDIEADKVDPGCWGLTMLKAASRKWGPFEWKRVSTHESSTLGIDPQKVILMPDAQSILLQFSISRYATVLEARFGVRPLGSNFKYYRLDPQPPSLLCCVWRRSNESPTIEKFVEFMTAYYGGMKGAIEAPELKERT